jgi:orotidine-5'-phosphate decarboxylase
VQDKLIVALDVSTAGRALELFEMLREHAGMFKVGLQLFTAAGPDIVKQIVGRGGRVFLDLKFHDIPNTVSAAAVEAARLGVSIFNVHALGGAEMMRRTADAVNEAAARESLRAPHVIAVSVLTSLDRKALTDIGVDAEPESLAATLARLAADNGMDGVVASPQEVEIVRRTVTPPGFLIVTPGVRPAGTAVDDQKRVMTGAAALRAGADYIVVGRPILNAPDPVSAADEIVAKMHMAKRQ